MNPPRFSEEPRFADRHEAGRRLAGAVRTRLAGAAGPLLVLGLPRGGVPVAWEVAQALAAPLDVLLVRKLRAPGQPELGLGAVVDAAPRPQVVLNDELVRAVGASPRYLEDEVRQQQAAIEQRRQLYRAAAPQQPVSGRTVVLVDDGIATGTTVRAAIRAVRQRQPTRLVLAVPVAPASELRSLRAEVDELVCLDAPAFFGSVGSHYRLFGQTSDEEVVALMDESGRHGRPLAAGAMQDPRR